MLGFVTHLPAPLLGRPNVTLIGRWRANHEPARARRCYRLVTQRRATSAPATW